jgi:hypothetical protein
MSDGPPEHSASAKKSYSSEVESNLYELGLLGSKARKKPPRKPKKGVEFRSPVVHDSTVPAPAFASSLSTSCVVLVVCSTL